MKNTKKLVFLDIDGTILEPRGTIHETVREAIRKLRGDGHRVFVCTGRSVHEMPQELKNLELDGAIASAGSDIWIGGENVRRDFLPPELIEKGTSLISRLGGIYLLESYEGDYISSEGKTYFIDTPIRQEDNAELVRWKTFFQSRVLVRDVSDWTQEIPVPKITFMIWGTDQIRKIQEELGDDFYVAMFQQSAADFRNGELISREVNKGTALRWTAQRLGVDPADTIAFGDSMNDYQMLEQAGVGVAMGGADEKLQTVADRFRESVAEDGVVRELERMGLI